MLRWLKAWGPFIVVLTCALVLTDAALAQSTGGSFGGGSFGGGGSGGGGGGYSGGGDDVGDGLVSFVVYVLLSRLPWPLKIALVGGAAAVFVVVKLARRRKDRDPPEGG